MPAICLGWSMTCAWILLHLLPKWPHNLNSLGKPWMMKPEPCVASQVSTVYQLCIYINYVHSKGWEVRWLFFCRLPFGSKPTKALRQRPLVTGVVLCHKGWWWSWFNAWNITLCGNAMWTALGGCCCWVVWVGCVGKMWNNQKSGSDKLE